MTAIRSRLSPEIDLDRDGKQTGFLRLPYSVHRSAYGWIPIPIAQIANRAGTGDGPSTLGRRPDTPEAVERAVDLMRVFGAPVGYLVDGGGWGDHTITAAAARVGIRHMSTELAGGGQVTPWALRIAESGIRRVLHALGALTSPPPPAEFTTRLMQVSGPDYYCYAPEPGLFEPLVELGAEIEAGAAAGVIHPHDTPWREPAIARFER